MVVITFDPDRYNFIVAGQNSYFLLRLADGTMLVVNDRCQHRGGPLHLGHWDQGRNCLVCPWHQTRYSEKLLRMSGVPLVTIKGQATAVLDEPEGTPVHLSPRAILVEPRCQPGQTAEAVL